MAVMLTRSDVAGPLSSGTSDLFELSDRSNETIFPRDFAHHSEWCLRDESF